MNVLVINAGSSSLKYQLLDVDTREVYAKGNCERIGIDGSFVGHEEMGGEKQKLEVALPDHKTAIKYVFDILKTVDKPIGGIGHRVVQGGWYFPESAVVTDETLAQVREVAPLAPLHNYAEADVIEICRDMFPELGNVIVAWRYALPRDVVDKYHVRKYGAHGTSHRFIWRTVHEMMGDKTHKLVSCHLGSGASLCAIQDGKCMDTTMGLTPLDGLIMGTRCGTLDPATVFYLSREAHMSVDEIDTMMNKKSGLLAVSEVSSDSRDIEAGAERRREVPDGARHVQLPRLPALRRDGRLHAGRGHDGLHRGHRRERARDSRRHLRAARLDGRQDRCREERAALRRAARDLHARFRHHRHGGPHQRGVHDRPRRRGAAGVAPRALPSTRAFERPGSWGVGPLSDKGR